MRAKVIRFGGMRFHRIDNGRDMRLDLNFRYGNVWEIISESPEYKTLMRNGIYVEISNEMFEKFFALEYLPEIIIPEIRKE